MRISSGPIAGLLLLISGPLGAQVAGTLRSTTADGVHTVEPAIGGVSVDGVLDEAAWATATPLTLPFETFPGDNTPARVETTCFITHDDERLYVGCRARDPDPSAIRAFVTDRDDVDGQDQVGIMIDPFNDARRAFEFAVTPLGVQSDGVFDQRSEGGTDRSWDAIWASSGRITEDGYEVELAIPFRSLRFPDTDGPQTWRVYAWRTWPRSESVAFRSMRLDRSNSCELCQANQIQGFAGVSAGANIEMVPTFTSSHSASRGSIRDGALGGGVLEAEPGLDVRWGVTTDLALNATVNPDFSQIEADVAQLDVNQRFALFFPEKRPFFLEGADLFATPIQAVFTRRIVDPVAGTKLSGKMGPHALGVMVALDEVTALTIPGFESSADTVLEGSATAMIARLRRDVGASSTIGVLYTGRLGERYGNHLGGVDGFMRPLDPLTIEWQYLRSSTDYPDQLASRFDQPAEAFGGDAFRSRVAYNTRAWRVVSMFETFDRGFRADQGFVNQVDIRRLNAWINRRFWGGENDFYTGLHLNGGAWHEERLDGQLNQQGVWFSFEFQLPWQTNGWINPNITRELYAGRVYEVSHMWSGISTRPTGDLQLGLEFNFGDAVDYANARQAFRLEIAPSAAVRLGRYMALRASHRMQRLSTTGEHIVTASLTQGRAVYSFSPRSYVRAIVQYRHTSRNPALNFASVDPRSSSVLTQLLFSYKVNPQTVFFLGYGDDRAGRIEETGEILPLTQLRRTLFVKMGYAWRP
jgi:hypothetical protein